MADLIYTPKASAKLHNSNPQFVPLIKSYPSLSENLHLDNQHTSQAW